MATNNGGVDFGEIGKAARLAANEVGGLPAELDREAGRAAVAAYLEQICGPDCEACPLRPEKCKHPLVKGYRGGSPIYVPGPFCPAMKKSLPAIGKANNWIGKACVGHRYFCKRCGWSCEVAEDMSAHECPDVKKED